jgi:ppGpp synthetase/RelA/SpoT-type nucleotidyltranferase
MEDINTPADSILTEYVRRQPLYRRLVEEVKFVLDEKLKIGRIKPASISGRVKEVESLRSKLSKKHYEKPLEQITDFAGVRVVCHYEADTIKVAELIRSQYEIQEHVDKSSELGVDKMGYNGAHFIVTLGSRYSGARYDGICALLCEIQVRTVLQDAWAMISHQLAYKNENSVPPRLRRDLNNVSSLLEIAQRIFDSVRDQRESYVHEIEQKESDPQAFLAQPLDYETLLAYTRWKFPQLQPSDKLNLRLLQDLDQQSYPTLSHIDRVIENAKDAVEVYRSENPDWFKSGTDFITKSLGFVDSAFGMCQ